jgi:replication-associated recombination protein RarA
MIFLVKRMVGEERLLRKAIEEDRVPSMIFWGLLEQEKPL